MGCSKQKGRRAALTCCSVCISPEWPTYHRDEPPGGETSKTEAASSETLVQLYFWGQTSSSALRQETGCFEQAALHYTERILYNFHLKMYQSLCSMSCSIWTFLVLFILSSFASTPLFNTQLLTMSQRAVELLPGHELSVHVCWSLPNTWLVHQGLSLFI